MNLRVGEGEELKFNGKKFLSEGVSTKRTKFETLSIVVGPIFKDFTVGPF